jgi:hypothetical protein
MYYIREYRAGSFAGVCNDDSSAASPLANRYPPVDSTAAAAIVAEENESPSTSNHHIVREYCLDHLDGSNPPARAPLPIWAEILRSARCGDCQQVCDDTVGVETEPKVLRRGCQLL